MKKVILSVVMLFTSLLLSANDGGFYISGNQLIPMIETRISVKREILTINRSLENPHQAEVTVYYEFYNPDKPKNMTVGFEASSPSGDADSRPVNGQQPYMHKFTVEMNGQKLAHKVAIVGDSLYYRNGLIKTLSKKEIEERTLDYGADYIYVYHFQANFKTGLNIIRHTYTCYFSTFVDSNYEFSYLLSPAMRWGNKQIDDFTLNINMGADQLLNINKGFYRDVNEWIIAGIGKKQNINNPYWGEDDSIGQFYIKNGSLIFQKQNFKPKGELYLSSPRGLFGGIEDFDYKQIRFLSRELMYCLFIDDADTKALDSVSKKILRNLPFAKRGYIFSNTELQKYFEAQTWYIPDGSYKPEIKDLPMEEQNWVKKFSE